MYRKTLLYGFKYKGWTYKGEWEDQGDVAKINHDCFSENGTMMRMNWNSYTVPTEKDFKLWVDSKTPKTSV